MLKWMSDDQIAVRSLYAGSDKARRPAGVNLRMHIDL